MNYMVTNEVGNALTCGLQEHEARRVAQQLADDLGEPVWLSEEGSEEEGERFDPAAADEDDED